MFEKCADEYSQINVENLYKKLENSSEDIFEAYVYAWIATLWVLIELCLVGSCAFCIKGCNGDLDCDCGEARRNREEFSEESYEFM